MKIMWNYSETFTSHRHKTIILYFLTTTCRSCSLVKSHVWINHVDTWHCFDDDATSMQLHIYLISTLKQLCLSKGIFSTILSSGGEQLYCNVEKVLENIYFISASCTTPFKDCLLLILIKEILIVSHSSSWVLQCTAP